tara:strand:- start:10699 stop:10953 length:255 start_codon:yes stop_codon:yes gene_type:complete
MNTTAIIHTLPEAIYQTFIASLMIAVITSIAAFFAYCSVTTPVLWFAAVTGFVSAGLMLLCGAIGEQAWSNIKDEYEDNFYRYA